MNSFALLYTLEVVLALLLGYGAAALFARFRDRRRPPIELKAEVVEPAPRHVIASRPVPELPEAARVATEDVREWLDKLEAEGRRTGRPRLVQQAHNIRERLGVR